jgi:formylglycine-generating enzyme
MKMWFIVLTLMLAAVPRAASATEESRIENDPVEMVVIPAGSFIRGSAAGEGRLDEQPRRKLYLDTFAIDKYEVSNARYGQFLEDTLHKPPLNVFGERPLHKETDIADLPVVQVTWHDAVDYCFWAGKRLPTEAEWEKAARGTDGRLFPWGNESPTAQRANYEKEWDGRTTFVEVTALPEGQSPDGLFNLSGNVREWVQDWYDPEYYSIAPNKNPKGPETGILKVIRGGSWKSFDMDLRTASRGKGGFALKTHGIGFRCARDIGPVTQRHRAQPLNGP